MRTSESETCATCAYAHQHRMNPQDIQTVTACKRFPPQVVALHKIQSDALRGITTTINVQALPLIVAPTDWCHEYKVRWTGQCEHGKVRSLCHICSNIDIA